MEEFSSFLTLDGLAGEMARTREKTGEGVSVRGKPTSSAPSSPRLERRGAPGSKREPTTEKVRPARTSSPRFLLVLKSRAAALFDRGCSKMGTSLSVACRPHALFETCCGGGLWLLVRASQLCYVKGVINGQNLSLIHI